MKLLMIFSEKFGYTPTIKSLEGFENHSEKMMFEDVQVAFIHAEKEDEVNEKSVEKKLLKNLKWLAGKNGTKRIILHSFAHLSESKASPEFTKSLFDRVEKRLFDTGYEVFQTPFGYFLDLEVNAPGQSLARVFKSF